MLAMIRSARSADSRISETRCSPVGEFEIGPSDYVIQGQQTLSLTVVR
jgi:hypothetical protein